MHEVVQKLNLAPIKKGNSIVIQVKDPNLTKEECIAFINFYRKQASPEGAVFIHKPSKKLDGYITAWCGENLYDGKGPPFLSS